MRKVSKGLLVCAPEDCPLGGWHRMGLAFLNQRLWPAGNVHNPLLYYLIGRQRGLWLEDLLALLPWMLLAVVNGVVAWLCIGGPAQVVKGLGFWLSSYLVQIIVFPLFLGTWVQVMMTVHYRRRIRIVPVEELNLTRLTPTEIMYGCIARPVSLQSAANVGLWFFEMFLFAVLIIAMLVVDADSVFGLLPLVIMAFLRFRLYQLCIELSSALALRSVLFIANTNAAVARMVRDWVYPWGVLLMIVTGVFLGLLQLLGFVTPLGGTVVVVGIFKLLVLALLMMVGYAFFFGPSMMRDYAAEIMFWLPRQYKFWAKCGGDSPLMVPESIFRRWQMFDYDKARKRRR